MKRCIFFLLNLLWSGTAFAQDTLDTRSLGADVPGGVGGMVDSVVSVLQDSIVAVAVACFTIGAGLYIISGEKEDRKNQGKEFMIGSLIGVAIVVAAKAILNLTLYFIYG